MRRGVLTVSPGTDAGRAAGAISTARYIGGVIGISALGLLLGTGAASIEDHNAATAVYLGALVVATISTLALPGKWKRPADRAR